MAAHLIDRGRHCTACSAHSLPVSCCQGDAVPCQSVGSPRDAQIRNCLERLDTFSAIEQWGQGHKELASMDAVGILNINLSKY